MRPPICEVCRRKAVETVRFADYEPLPDGMVGHPRGLGWFCRWHLAGARALDGRTMGAAVRRLRVVTALVLVLVIGALAVLGLAGLVALSSR